MNYFTRVQQPAISDPTSRTFRQSLILAFKLVVTELLRNALPASLRFADSIISFKLHLKTHLFTLAFG